MSMNPNVPPESYQAYPEKRGGSKSWLGWGIGCAVVVLLCCGGGVALMYFGAREFQQAVNQDPVVIDAVARQIAEVDIPEEFKPQMSIDLKVPVINRRIMTMAVYQAPAGNLMLAEFPGDLQEVNAEELQEKMKEQLDSQGQGGAEMEVSESHELSLEVRGQPAKFVIQHGENPQTNTELIQAMGTFKGETGVGMLIMQVEADQFSEEQVEQVIRSIR
jgi:glyceraldehyde-3-phosphate dehydrogenase/erythrose-4-phosphate dehydrogenase